MFQGFSLLSYFILSCLECYTVWRYLYYTDLASYTVDRVICIGLLYTFYLRSHFSDYFSP